MNMHVAHDLNAADFAEIIGHQVDPLVVAVGHDRRRPIGRTHHKNSYATEPSFKRNAADSFPTLERDAG